MAWSWSVAVAAVPKKDLDKPIEGCRKFDEGPACGEDSFTVLQTDEYCIISVADGVGGWRRKGIDPGAFSRSLMDQVGEVATATHPSRSPSLEILRKAFTGLVRSYTAGGEEPFGASTICVGVLGRINGVLDLANLGDSGAVLVRHGRVFLATERQQSHFNAPYQLVLEPSGRSKGQPSRADHQFTQVQDGDVLLMATDGLWDNLTMHQIIQDLRKHVSGADDRLDEEAAALELADHARRQAIDHKASTPFSSQSAESGYTHAGGKQDDITIILARLHRIDHRRLSR